MTETKYTTSTVLAPRKNVDWKNEFIPIINNILDQLARYGEKPSVRGMWYILVSRYPDRISNIPSMYSSYDKAITKARKAEYGEGKSRLEEDAFVDNVRQIIDIIQQPQAKARKAITALANRMIAEQFPLRSTEK